MEAQFCMLHDGWCHIRYSWKCSTRLLGVAQAKSFWHSIVDSSAVPWAVSFNNATTLLQCLHSAFEHWRPLQQGCNYRESWWAYNIVCKMPSGTARTNYVKVCNRSNIRIADFSNDYGDAHMFNYLNPNPWKTSWPWFDATKIFLKKILPDDN